MLGYSDRRPIQASGAFDIGGLADIVTLPIPFGKWKIEDVWVVWTGADVATVAAIEFAHRPAAGTDASRTAACGSAALNIIKPTGNQTGKLCYKRAAADYFVQGGGEIVVSVSVSATTTTVMFLSCVGVTLRESPEDPANMTTAAGGGGLVKSA